MSEIKQPILVFGATGQQGGSVTASLLKAGWPVRALVRDTASPHAAALGKAGVELFQGDFDDIDEIRKAMKGAYGVFSVQPSSPGGAVTDAQEVRYGVNVADLAVESGVKHLVYSSGNGVGDTPTGIAHFDTKSRIEAHIRTLPITATVIRPAAFMEMLMMPGFGLDESRFNFFLHRDQVMQLLAVEDIGKFVTAIFADPARFDGHTLELASDAVTGADLEARFTEAAGRPIVYSRFSHEVLAANPFLAGLTALVDAGPLAGNADLNALRAINPEMQLFRSWLARSGRDAFAQALGATGGWDYNKA